MSNDRLPSADHFRPLHLKLMMGALAQAWRAGLLPPADLCPERLRHMAETATGLSADRDGRAFFDRQLAVLLPALHEEARLNDFGRLVAHGTILKLMKERLWFEAVMAAHPEIDRIELAPPLFIVGPMRSGSTRVQRLLAAHPAHNALRLFEAQCPVPSPRVLAARQRGRRDPRIGQASWMLRLIASINPAVLDIHPTGAQEHDEELGLLEQSLSPAMIEVQRHVPTFARHCESEDQTPAYARLRRLLKLRTWLEGADPAKPYVLKTPQHMQDIEAVTRVFPKSRLIFLHRDPVAVVASSASLVWNQMVIHSDHVDPHWIGREWLQKTEVRMRRVASARTQIATDRQLDLGYDEVEADWEGAMRKVEVFLDQEVTPEAFRRMRQYLDRADRARRFGRHDYQLELFGIRRDEIAKRLADDYQ